MALNIHVTIFKVFVRKQPGMKHNSKNTGLHNAHGSFTPWKNYEWTSLAEPSMKRKLFVKWKLVGEENRCVI